jgi:enoyl-CoA hydratase
MDHIGISVSDGIAELVLRRPKVNAMNQALLGELEAHFVCAAADDAIKGVLVRAEGKAFSAGLDLFEVAGLDDVGLWRFLELFDRAFTAAFSLTKPLAVAVEGHAIAGGAVLALCADYLALAPGDYKVGLTELVVGVPFPRSAFEIVNSALPPRGVRMLVNGAGTHPPAEAFALGVGDVLVAEPRSACAAWLAPHVARAPGPFRIAKIQQRGEAWRRIAQASLAERSDLVNVLLTTRAAAAGGLAR